MPDLPDFTTFNRGLHGLIRTYTEGVSYIPPFRELTTDEGYFVILDDKNQVACMYEKFFRGDVIKLPEYP